MAALLKLLRIVNLPTVPGDVLVGAALVAFACPAATAPLGTMAFAVLASACVYLFALADNDVVGAATDGPSRPIPAGELTIARAKTVRAALLAGVFLFGFLAPLRLAGWVALLALLALSFIYNRRRNAFVMGLCRALNVLFGVAVLVTPTTPLSPRLVGAGLLVAVVWTAFVASLTAYSKDEDAHPERRAAVSRLIGGLVYLQLTALLACYWLSPTPFSRALLLTGAVLLIVQRLVKRLLPGVSGS